MNSKQQSKITLMTFIIVNINLTLLKVSFHASGVKQLLTY